MNIYGATQLAEAFRTVRKNTIIIAEEVPEESYGFAPAPGSRTIVQTFAHIAGITEIPLQIHKVQHVSDLATFDFFGAMARQAAEAQKARTKAEIVALLKESGEAFASWLGSLSDEFLAEVVKYPPPMSPPAKTRFEMLLGAKEHEMHHRGQVMLIQRILGATTHLTRQMEANIAAMRTAGSPNAG